MRTHSPRRRRARRLALTLALLFAGLLSGVLIWLLAQTALLLTLHAPLHLPLTDARRASWRLVFTGCWSAPASAFPFRAQRLALPGATGWLAAVALLLGMVAAAAWSC